jgi:hypothetical protein
MVHDFLMGFAENLGAQGQKRQKAQTFQGEGRF